MEEKDQELRPLGYTPTWSIATILTLFVAVSFLVERAIYYLSKWLRKTNKKPLLAAVEKMQEEMMLLGFLSLLLTATENLIANICVPVKFYNRAFAPCARVDIEKGTEKNSSQEHRLLMVATYPQVIRRTLEDIQAESCKEGYIPFVSYEGLEQLHRFIFLMAVTHISYSCLTILLSIVKIHSWRVWEKEVHNYSLDEMRRYMTMQGQTTLVQFHRSNILVRNTFLTWVSCFLRQFWNSVVRTDYLILRKGFIMNHNLTLKYDFHSYLTQNTEEEFEQIVGLSVHLWGFVVAFLLFNTNGSHLYFWIAIIPNSLVPIVGAKLQHIIATLALENAEITGFFSETKLTPRDELFWFRRPKLLLSFIHFVLFQNSFELTSFFWFWWQFGYNSCFLLNHLIVYVRLAFGFVGLLICGYSTLPLYALVAQMGTKYKAALIPEGVRETTDYWGEEARRKKRHGTLTDDLESQPLREESIENKISNRPVTPLRRHSAPVSASVAALRFRAETIRRTYSIP